MKNFRVLFTIVVTGVMCLLLTMSATPVEVPQIAGTWRFTITVDYASDQKPILDGWTQRLIFKQNGASLKVYNLLQTIDKNTFPFLTGTIKKDKVMVESIECDGGCIERYTLKLSKDGKTMTGAYYHHEAEGEPEITNKGTITAVRVK